MQPLFISSFILAVASVVSAAPVLKRSGSYKGTATWYKPATEGGSEGACHGVEINNNSDYVALNHPQYGNLNSNSNWCGKTIRIKGPKGSTTAKIMDACPECSEGDLDLTPALFKKVAGSMNLGVAKITWELE